MEKETIKMGYLQPNIKVALLNTRRVICQSNGLERYNNDAEEVINE